MHCWYATQSGPVRHMNMQFERKCRMSYGVHVSGCSCHFLLIPSRSCRSATSGVDGEDEVDDEDDGGDEEDEEDDEDEDEGDGADGT